MDVLRILRCNAALSLSKVFVVVMAALLAMPFFNVLPATADSEPLHPAANPVTVFEKAGAMKFTFQICSNDMNPSAAAVDFQLGETVYFRLGGEMYQEGYQPHIANNTLFTVTDSSGTIVWNTSMGEINGGLFGGVYMVVKWTPETAGDYTAEVALEAAYSVGDVSSVIPFRVFDPCPFTGQVTELYTGTPIFNATIEALQGDEIKATATTDTEGYFTMQLEKSGTYNVRVSASGYVTTVFQSVATKLENTSLALSIAPADSASTFNMQWTQPLGTNCRAAVDSEGNIVTVEGIGTVTVIKRSPDGDVLWNISKYFSGHLGPLTRIAVDSSRNIFLLLDFTQNDHYDLCTVKLDPFGHEIWAKTFDSGENDFGGALTVDSQNNVLVGGQIWGATHIEGATALIKYDSEGTLTSSKIVNGSFLFGDLLIDAENNVMLAGSAYSHLTELDYYIAKFDSNDTLIWTQTFTTDGKKADNCKAAALDASGNIVVIGDKCLIKLDPDGNILWNRHFTGNDLAVDKNDNIIAVDGSLVKIFSPSGHFLGHVQLGDDLCSVAFDAKGNLIVAGAQSLTKLAYSIPQILLQKDPASRGIVPNQSSLEMYESTLSFAFIIPLLVVAVFVVGRFLKRRAS